MGCPSPDIAVKYPVSRHPLPDPPSRTPEEYEAKGYCLSMVEDVLPGDLVDQLYVPCIWREMRIAKTFSFRATTTVVGAGKPPRER